jgi:hypothetical protein
MSCTREMMMVMAMVEQHLQSLAGIEHVTAPDFAPVLSWA